MPCLAGKPSAADQEVWPIYAWTQVDIYYPTLTIQHLPSKIPSSDYFWIPFLRRQNNLLDNSHCCLFLHRPPPEKKTQEDSEFDLQKPLDLCWLPSTTNELQATNHFSSDPWLTTAPEAECAFFLAKTCHGAAIPAVLPRMLPLWLTLLSLCSPTQQTAQRPGQVSVLSSCILASPWEMGAGPGSQKDHSSDGMTSCSVALEEDVPCGVLLLGWWRIQGWRGLHQHWLIPPCPGSLEEGLWTKRVLVQEKWAWTQQEVTSSRSWTRLTSQRCRDLPVPGCMSDETPSPHTCSLLQLHSQDDGRWL